MTMVGEVVGRDCSLSLRQWRRTAVNKNHSCCELTTSAGRQKDEKQPSEAEGGTFLGNTGSLESPKLPFIASSRVDNGVRGTHTRQRSSQPSWSSPTVRHRCCRGCWWVTGELTRSRPRPGARQRPSRWSPPGTGSWRRRGSTWWWSCRRRRSAWPSTFRSSSWRSSRSGCGPTASSRAARSPGTSGEGDRTLLPRLPLPTKTEMATGRGLIDDAVSWRQF